MNQTSDSDSPMINWEGSLMPRVDIVLKFVLIILLRMDLRSRS